MTVQFSGQPYTYAGAPCHVSPAVRSALHTIDMGFAQIYDSFVVSQQPVSVCLCFAPSPWV